MPNADYGVSLSVGGIAINKQITRTASHPNPYVETLNVALAGTLTTRTDDDSGVITSAGHGLANTNVVDVYWNGGMRYGMVLSSVDTNTVTVGADAGSVGVGDNLPAANSAVQVCLQHSINTAIDGDAIEIAGVCLEYSTASNAVGHLDMQDSGGTSVVANGIDLVANQPQVWDIDAGQTNIFTGNAIAVTKASHSDTTNTATLKILSLEEA